jgi:hypothetical protein
MSSTGLLLHHGMGGGNALTSSLDMRSKLSKVRKRLSKPEHFQQERKRRNKTYRENMHKYSTSKGQSPRVVA